jgi:trk system potassium uptake protein TrkA
VTNIPLSRLRLKSHLLVACINRAGRVLIPGGSDEIKVGDSVIIVTTHTGFDDVQDILR